MYKKFKSLSDQIVELLGVEVNSKEFNLVFTYCLEHICLQTPIKQFHTNLSSIIDFKNLEVTPSKFRLAISKSGYVILNMRFYAIYLCSSRKVLRPVVYDFYRCQFNIDKQDCETLRYMLSKKVYGDSSLRTVIRSMYSTADTSFYSPESMNACIEEFGMMLDDVYRFIDRVVEKRLRFIKRTYNMTHDEFSSELMFSAIKAHYKSKPNDYPFEKSLNIVRRSIDNAAINIIKLYTSNKRERLVNEGEDASGSYVFSLRVVSENQLNLQSMSGDDIDTPYDSMFSSTFRLNMERSKDIDFSVDQLLRKYGVYTRHGKLISLFFRTDCPLFGSWLLKNKYLRSELKSTQDFMDSKTREELLDIVSKYLNTTVESLLEISLPSMARKLGLM